jgi:hypothetical protein
MKRFSTLSCTLIFALNASTALPRVRHEPPGSDQAFCAFEAQKAMARRHRLAASGSGSDALGIYANPQMSLEADNAFDACVRRQNR